MRSILASALVASLMFVALRFGGFKGAQPETQPVKAPVHTGVCALGTYC